MCNNWPHFPIGVYGATGGLIEDTVIICGGWVSIRGMDSDGSYVDECYGLTSEKAKLVIHMSVGRTDAASIVINDNILWVTGGSDYGGSLASTEYVTVIGTMPGPDLPMTLGLHSHAMVAINRTCSMVIGGYSLDYFVDPSLASAFFYDHNEGEWINGPSLVQVRYRHAAGIVTDEVTDEDLVAVTGGYVMGFEGPILDSTEILQDGEWVQGKISNTICYLLESVWYQNTITTIQRNLKQKELSDYFLK